MKTVILKNVLEQSLHMYCLNPIELPIKIIRFTISPKGSIEISQNNANTIFLVTLMIGNLLVSYYDNFDKLFVSDSYTIDINRSEDYLTFQGTHNSINFKPISQMLCKEV